MKRLVPMLLLTLAAGLPLSTAMAQGANELLAPQVGPGAPAPAAEPAQPEAKAPPEAKTQAAVADPDRMVCKSERVTGSTLPKRVCKTASQRAAEEQASRNFLDQAGRRHSSFTGG
jgi:hypothetical protein